MRSIAKRVVLAAFSAPDLCGDAGNNGIADILNGVYLLMYILGGKTAPCPTS